MRKSANNTENSFHLYEIGKSDPNQILPREFKQHFNNVPPSDVIHKTTYDRLAELTSQPGRTGLVVKRPS